MLLSTGIMPPHLSVHYSLRDELSSRKETKPLTLSSSEIVVHFPKGVSMSATIESKITKNSKINSFLVFWTFLKLSLYTFKIALDLHKLSINNTEVEIKVWVDNLTLSERDSRFLLSILENPPEPSSGLLSVFD